LTKTTQLDLASVLAQVRSWWKYRWHAAAFSWVFCVLGWTAVAMAPRRYQATARVRVDTQGILGPLLRGLAVQPDRDRQLAMMSRTLLSRPNLEKVVDATPELNVAKGSEKEKDEAISQLEGGIRLQATDRNNLYTFTFSHTSPTAAKAVVESLLAMLVQSVAGEQTRDTRQAQGFLNDQLAEYEKKLAEAEAAVSDFKRKNPSFESGRDYFARLNDAESALSTARLELTEAENRRDALRKQVEEETQAEPGVSEVAIDPQLPVRIQEVRRNLDQLRLRFTEEHPDVVTARVSLQALEQEQQAALAAARRAGGGQRRARPAVQNLEGFQQLQLATAEAEGTVASLKARVSEYRRRYNRLKATADKMPETEARFAGLNREYEANRKNFQELLARRDSVQISEDANTQPGLDAFRIVDPPRVPQAPAFPGPPLLASIVTLVGLLGGVVVAFLMSQLRPTFANARMLREATGLNVLGTVSSVWTPPERLADRRRVYAWVGAYVGLLVAFAGVVAVLQMSLQATS
jgi:polysaccharide chain length determinant protein (PEP-CTERM system associated)